jgi:hypothetical protein
MSRRDDFRNVERYCIVCRSPIPQERKSDAITCSKECTKKRKDFSRSKLDAKACRYCLRPSTPEERTRYLAWRRAEKKAAKEQEASQ